jgi:hypothetical protein
MWTACTAPPDADPWRGGAPSAELPTVRVAPADGRPVVEAPARLVPTATATAEVTFLAAGTVRRVWVRPGDRVQRSDALIEIASPTLATAAAEWRGAVDRLGLLDQRLERLSALAAERIATQDDLQKLREERAGLMAERRRRQGELLAHGVARENFDRLHRTGTVRLTSPITGIVRRLPVRLGQAVGPGSPVAAIVGEGTPRVEATLDGPPSDGLTYAFVSATGQRWMLRAPPIGALADPDTGTWTVWFAVQGAPRVAGARVGVLHAAPAGSRAYVVPLSAIGRDPEPFVLRRGDDGVPERVAAEVLHLGRDEVVIRAPLEAGARIVADPSAAEGRGAP